jgi:prepilin-type N-terminal cleavage/methylation domain-containing protein
VSSVDPVYFHLPVSLRKNSVEHFLSAKKDARISTDGITFAKVVRRRIIAASTKTQLYRTYMQIRARHSGFTLVEIMIVVAIIALLAAIAVPNFMRARKRAQATFMLQDLKELNAAVDQYAIETNKGTGFVYNWGDLMPYVKKGGRLYNSFWSTGTGAADPLDLYGHTYRSMTAAIDEPAPGLADISLNPLTFATLSDVAPSDFWSPYGVATSP